MVELLIIFKEYSNNIFPLVTEKYCVYLKAFSIYSEGNKKTS